MNLYVVKLYDPEYSMNEPIKLILRSSVADSIESIAAKQNVNYVHVSLLSKQKYIYHPRRLHYS